MQMRYTEEKLNTFSKETLIQLFLAQQEQLSEIDKKLQLVLEQLAVMNQNRYGRKTEQMPVPQQMAFADVNGVLDYMTTSGKGNHSDGVLAWTEFYKSGKNINPSTVNWKYCYVKIYKTNFNKLTKNGRKGTIAHEAGHAFGLAHNQGNPKSIMCQTKYGRAVSSAQICDLKGINHLYK